MGNSGSASKTELYSTVQKTISNTFTQECSARTRCTQSFEMGNVNIKARGNCQVRLGNKCDMSMDAQCNMDNALRSLAPYLFQMEKQHAGILDALKRVKTDSGDRPFNATLRTEEDVVNAFKQACGVDSETYQTIRTGNFTFECYDNVAFSMMNEANHSGVCVAQMMNRAIDALFSGIPPSSDAPSSTGETASSKAKKGADASTTPPSPPQPPASSFNQEHALLLARVAGVLIPIVAIAVYLGMKGEKDEDARGREMEAVTIRG